MDTEALWREPQLQVEHDLERDSMVIKQTNELGMSSTQFIPYYQLAYTDPRLLYQQLRSSTADNDINTLYGMQNACRQYTYGAENSLGFRKKFPRSEQEMNAIMIRRVNARLQLAQERRTRRWKHIGIGVGVVVLLPLAIAIVSRLWNFSFSWIAS